MRPGLHYIVREPQANDDYVTFAPSYANLRNSWVIVRRAGPHVPVLEGSPLPSPSRSKEENGKYFSLFFRPWTLVDTRPDVPHLSQLGRTYLDTALIPQVTCHKRPRTSKSTFANTSCALAEKIIWNDQYIHSEGSRRRCCAPTMTPCARQCAQS